MAGDDDSCGPCVERLLLLKQSQNGMCALLRASQYRGVDCIRVLVESGIDIETKDNVRDMELCDECRSFYRRCLFR